MMRPIVLGIPYLTFAFIISSLSNLLALLRGKHPVALENLYCKILLKIHWHISFGLDEFVADVIEKEPARHEQSLINILNGHNKEFSGLAFSTLHLYFDNENTCHALEQFVNSLDTEEEKAEYRRKLG